MKKIPKIGGIFISKKIIEGHSITFLFRNVPTNDSDSGWVLFSGLEDDEYANNPNNYGIYAMESILKIDNSLVDILLNSVGAVFERSSKNENWQIVRDYILEDDYLIIDRITQNWQIEISQLFQKVIKKDDSITYIAFQKTIKVIHHVLNNKAKENLFDYQLDQIKARLITYSPILEQYELKSQTHLKLAYLTTESDVNKTYFVLYNYTFIDQEVLQSAIYFDDFRDKEWAISTWKNIQHIKTN